MGTLKNCLKANKISDAQAKVIREWAAQYREDGHPGPVANERAVRDLIKRTEDDLAEIMAQVKERADAAGRGAQTEGRRGEGTPRLAEGEEGRLRVRDHAEARVEAPEGEEVKYSVVTPAQDRAYMEAVERGDTKTAQKMVDEAAKAAGHVIGPAPHGTTAPDFTIFKTPSYFGHGAGMYSHSNSDLVSWKGNRLKLVNKPNLSSITETTDLADSYGIPVGGLAWPGGDGIFRYEGENSYGEPRWSLIENWQAQEGENYTLKDVVPPHPPDEKPRIVRAYIKMQNPAQLTAKEGEKLSIGQKNGKYDKDLHDRLIAQGHDGAIAPDDWGGPWHKHYIPFYPNQIKSADAITYDDAGNVIPLSQRFNPSKEDIRYSVVPGAPHVKQTEGGQQTTRKQPSYIQRVEHEAGRLNLDVMEEARPGSRQDMIDALEALPAGARKKAEQFATSVSNDEAEAVGEALLKSRPGMLRRMGKLERGAGSLQTQIITLGRHYLAMYDAAQQAKDAYQANPNDARTRAELNQANAAMYAAMMNYMGKKSEAGRGLQAARSLRTALDANNPQITIQAALAKRGIEMSEEELAALMTIPQGDHAAFVRFMNEAIRKRERFTLRDWVDSFRYFNMLSGTNTHAYNWMSNMLWIGDVAIRQPIESVVDLAKWGLTLGHVKRARYMGDWVAGMRGSIAGAPSALRGAWEILTTGMAKAQAKQTLADTDKYGGYREAPGGGKNPLNWTSRLLSAADFVFSQSRYLGALEQLATRQAMRDENLRGQALRDRVREMVSSGELHEEAEKEGRRATFTNDAVTQRIMGFLRRHDETRGAATVLNYLFPFMRVSENIARRGVAYTPGLGAIRLFSGNTYKNPGKASQVVAEQVLGSALALAGYALASADNATGEAPDDPKEKERFYDLGKTSYSVNIPGVGWIRWNRLGPVAFPFVVGVALRERMDKDPEGKLGVDEAKELISVLARTFGDMTLVTQLGNIMSLFERGRSATDAATRLARNTASQFVPASAQMRQWTALFDPYLRETRPLEKAEDVGDLFELMAKEIYNGIKSGIPVASQTLAPRISQFGQPIQRGNKGAAAFSPAVPRRGNEDPVIRELAELGVEYPGIPASSVKGEKLSPGEHYRMRMETGQPIYDALARTMKSASWFRMTKEQRKAQADRIIKQYTTKIRKVWRTQNRRVSQ